jgi:sugar-specific transcriptional regulator TrmB
VSFSEQDTQRLTEIGFTKNQAKLYLTLLKLGKTNGKTLSKHATASRPVVYRTLDELQKMGLVEREITSPYKFKATPLKQGLQILMAQKLQQYEENRERTEEFLLKKENCLEENLKEQEYRFNVVEGKERIIQIMKLQHDNVHRRADILSTLPRWLQILNCCFENYKKALQRKVKYRVVIDKPENAIVFPDNLQVLLEKPNFELRVVRSPLQNNFGIFDDNEATFNFFPSKALKESPIIWTNHPGFISMARDQFEKVWRLAQEYKPENKNS